MSFKDKFKKAVKKYNPSKVAAKTIGKYTDKLFSENLARQWRSFDPIARMMGEEYQRHVFGLFAPGVAPVTDYYSGRARGMDRRTATRHGYQNILKSAAVWGTIYLTVSSASNYGSGASGASGATGAEVGASGVGSATPAASSGTANFSLPATNNVGEGLAAETASLNATAASANIGGVTAGGGGGPVSDGFLTKLGENAVGPAIIVAGQALASANTPSAGEETEESLEAIQRRNSVAGIGTQRKMQKPYIAPYQPRQRTRVLTPQEMLAAANVGQNFDPTNPSGGLLTQNSVLKRAGYGG